MLEVSGTKARPRGPKSPMWLGIARGIPLVLLVACVTPARSLTPTEAPVVQAKAGPPLEIGQHEWETPENPFSSDAVVPCREEDDRAAARQAIDNMKTSIWQLDESSTDAARRKVEVQLKALLDTPCFELAKADLREPLVFDSALSLRTWWIDAGGEYFLSRRVAKKEDERESRASSSYDSQMIAGAPRSSLLLPGNEGHPLAPLLCAPTDGDCGRETSGWVRRAQPTFRPTSTEYRDPMGCEKTTMNAEPNARWSALITCNVESAPSGTVMPLGRFRSMKDGYFVITHPPSSCAYLDVYDLASGTFVQSTYCSQRGKADTTVGRVPVATIREAAWMMAMAYYAKDNVRESMSFAVPRQVVPGRTRESLDVGHLYGSHYYSRSRQATWTWYRHHEGKLVAQVTGTVYGGPSSTASSYAYELLQIAEEAKVEGCAPDFSSAALASIPWSQTGAMVHPSLTMPFELQADVLQAARAAVPKAKTPKKCTEPM